MSVIIGGFFRDQLARVNARASVSQTNPPKVQREFSGVLEDLDPRRRALDELKNTSKTALPAEVLTNIDSFPHPVGEAALAIKNKEQALGVYQGAAKQVLNSGELTPVKLTNPVPVPVSEPTQPVKVSPPVPQVIAPKLTEKAPEAPLIRSARWILDKGDGENKISHTITNNKVHGRSGVQYSKPEIREIITDTGEREGLDPLLSLAVAHAESSLRPGAVSRDGHQTKGIFQLMDSTGKEWMGRMEIEGEYDPFDPKLNAKLGLGYLRHLHDIFQEETDLGIVQTHPAKSENDLEKIAVAAFNAGQGRVAQAQARAQASGLDPGNFEHVKRFLPVSTREYVAKVTGLREALEDVA